MRKFRGFHLKKRVFKLFRGTRWMSGYRRLENPHPICNSKPVSALFSCLKTKVKSLCRARPGRVTYHGYTHLGQDPVPEKAAVDVPKGHLAVYVGQKDGEFRRVMVPVIYFNHPLFGELLREAEKEFGYNHSGGITLPCRISEFEKVQTRIAAGSSNRKLMMWKRSIGV